MPMNDLSMGRGAPTVRWTEIRVNSKNGMALTHNYDHSISNVNGSLSIARGIAAS